MAKKSNTRRARRGRRAVNGPLNPAGVQGIKIGASGLYELKNSAGKPIYVGITSIGRKRVARHYQKQDPNHPNTARFKGKAKRFKFKPMSLRQAKTAEKKIKAKRRYNVK